MEFCLSSCKNITTDGPIRMQRLKFKTVVLVFKCIRGQAPVYLSEYCKSTNDNTGHSHFAISQHVSAACSTDMNNL